MEEKYQNQILLPVVKRMLAGTANYNTSCIILNTLQELHFIFHDEHF